MSKKSRKVQHHDSKRAIHQSLRADFHCTEDDIDLIDRVLENMIPAEMAEQVQAILEGKVEAPEPQGGLALDMGDGTTQYLTLTNHPINLLHHYFTEQFGLSFGQLYWTAFTSRTYKDFYQMLQWFKRSGIYTEMKTELEARQISKVESGQGHERSNNF